MAQGAGQAIEDAVVLARAIGAADGVESAFATYEAARRERTARIQLASRGNEWLKAGGGDKTAADWVYGYDAWSAPLSNHPLSARIA